MKLKIQNRAESDCSPGSILGELSAASPGEISQETDVTRPGPRLDVVWEEDFVTRQKKRADRNLSIIIEFSSLITRKLGRIEVRKLDLGQEELIFVSCREGCT